MKLANLIALALIKLYGIDGAHLKAGALGAQAQSYARRVQNVIENRAI